MASVGKAYLHALGPSKQLIGDIESRFLILLAANIPFFLSLSTFLCVQCFLKLSFFFFFFLRKAYRNLICHSLHLKLWKNEK